MIETKDFIRLRQIFISQPTVDPKFCNWEYFSVHYLNINTLYSKIKHKASMEVFLRPKKTNKWSDWSTKCHLQLFYKLKIDFISFFCPTTTQFRKTFKSQLLGIISKNLVNDFSGRGSNCLNENMTNPHDRADASINRTNEIITVYLLNLLGFIP